MTTIYTVVDTSSQLPQREEPHTPVQDFAHELAKQAAQAKRPAQGNAGAAAHEGFDEQQAFEPLETHVAVDSLPQASMHMAVLQQVEAAEPVMVMPTEGTKAVLEARVFGWHAMAQAYLSELTASDGSVKRSDTWGTDQADLTASMTFMGQFEPVNDVSAWNVADKASLTQPVEISTHQPALVLDDTAPEAATESAVVGSSAPALWPERSLRFTRQRDGTSVAWLRDFRISDAEASRLIRWVVSEATDKGIALSKIMLNGREAWASPNSIKE